jgi:hypothetical protein
LGHNATGTDGHGQWAGRVMVMVRVRVRIMGGIHGTSAQSQGGTHGDAPGGTHG